MANSIKDQLNSDLQKAKEEGKLRTDRVREIVQSAVALAISELREGSGEVRSIVKDAVSTIVENLQEKGQERKEEITASIEGLVQGLSQAKRENIAKSQAEVKQLQSQIDSDEADIQSQIDSALTDIQETTKETSPDVRSTIESAVDSLKDTEEVALMRKRYAQLQAQLAILQANLAERYGDRFEEVNKHLDTAKDWYTKTRPQAEVTVDRVKEKSTDFENQLGEAGTALAKKEQHARQLLKELLSTATELFQEKLSQGRKEK